MNGTQKQIEWAESIINIAISKGQDNLIHAQERYERMKDQHPNELKIWNMRQAVERAILKFLQNQNSASWIIDHRNNIRWAAFISGAKDLSKEEQDITIEFFPKADDLRNWIG